MTWEFNKSTEIFIISGNGISRYDIEADDSIQVNENEEFYALWNPTANYEINYSKLSDYKVKMDYEDSETSVTFSASYDSVLIYEIDKNAIGINVDKDNDGIYETLWKEELQTTNSDEIVTSGKNLTTKETTSKSVTKVANNKVSKVKKLTAKKKSLKVTWKKLKVLKDIRLNIRQRNYSKNQRKRSSI